MILIYITVTMGVSEPPPRAKMEWLRVNVAAAAEVLTRGGKGNVTHAECCTLLEVRVQNALKKCLEEFQGLKALKCMSSIEDFVGISLVSPITRAARTYKEAKNTSAWQLAVLETSKNVCAQRQPNRGGKGVRLLV
jgi:hypothetical protein